MSSPASQRESSGRAPSANRLFWTICLLGWMALLTVTVTSILVAGFRPFTLVIIMALALWLPYVLLTPLVFLMVQRFPFTTSKWRANLGLHLMASLFFVLIGESASFGIAKTLGPNFPDHAITDHVREPRPPFPRTPPSSLPAPSVGMSSMKAVANLQLYWVLAALSHAILATARLREREKQAAELSSHLAQARLASLRTQLQPHFLFNTLNSISALIPQNPALANEMVLNLSDLLRMTLRDSPAERIQLREELKLLGCYVDIQKLRFGARLNFELDLGDNCLDFLVAPLLLQPLVENAIRYGIEPSEQPERIVVRARLTDQALTLEVVNSGRPENEDSASRVESNGIGLANTQARLAALYGPSQVFQYGRLPDGGFRVNIKLPRPGADLKAS
jgi:hypothetical protein